LSNKTQSRNKEGIFCTKYSKMMQ